jgi:hypothetical protein
LRRRPRFEAVERIFPHDVAPWVHPYGSVPKGCAWFPISTAENGNEVTLWLQLLLLVLLLGCSDPPAPPPSSQSGASSAQPAPDSSGAPSAVEPPPQSSTGILALGHARAFETYDWTHIGEDQYYHGQTLGLVTLSAPADDAMTSCRRFDYAGSSQVVCAVHGDLPGAPLSFATLPANLVPATEAGRETALDLLCIDIKLRGSSQRRIWAFGPDARGKSQAKSIARSEAARVRDAQRSGGESTPNRIAAVANTMLADLGAPCVSA